MNKTTLLLTTLVSASALAQENTPPPPPPPQRVDSPVRAEAPVMTEQDPGGRVRWGVSGNLGWFVPHSAFTLGAEGKIGYQVSNLFSAYGILGGTFGFGFGGTASSTGGSVGIVGVGYYFVGAVAELMFADIFYVGGGALLAGGGYGVAGISAGTGGGSVTAIAAGGFAPGLDVRLGLGLGRTQPAPSFRRGGFNLGLDAKILFHPNTSVTRVEGSSGGGSVNVVTNELSVSVTPMLTLGYDMR